MEPTELIEPVQVLSGQAQGARTGSLVEKPQGMLMSGASPTPAELLRIAMERGANMDLLERLMALQERHEANEARKAFVDNMAAFKCEPLDIFKRKEVGYTTKDGDFVGYKHAELSDVVAVVVPALARNGFSHRWDVKQEQGRVFVTCIVTHRAGHSESLTMDAAPDDSGKKNKLQQVASTVTYLQRYTLLGITGTAAKGMDDDGAGSGEDEGAGDEQSELLESLLADIKTKQTDAAALAHYTTNVAKLAPNVKAQAAFKAAVVAHRNKLKEGATA